LSVLIEAVSLVVPAVTIDDVWPGGTTAFLHYVMSGGEGAARHAIRDATLVSVSFAEKEYAQRVVDQIRAHGLVELNGKRATDLVIVDEAKGPLLPCQWLAWRQHPDGFTFAWMTNIAPGPMVTPADWVADPGRRLTAAGRRAVEHERMFKLAEDDASETWLDFETGEVSTGEKRVPLPAAELRSSASPAGELLGIVTTVLDERDWIWHRFDEDSIFSWVRTAKATYELFISADDPQHTLGIYLIFPTHAPKWRCAAVAELCARASWDMSLGTIEVDFADGDVRFRVGIDVADSTLSASMVHRAISTGTLALDRWHDALVKVMVAGEDPAAAFEAVQG